MTIQKAIEAAIDGGFDLKWVLIDGLKDYSNAPFEEQAEYYLHLADGDVSHLLLNREFWQALGKTMGWLVEEVKYSDNMHGIYRNSQMPVWEINWHRMIDALAEGNTIEQYFETL